MPSNKKPEDSSPLDNVDLGDWLDEEPTDETVTAPEPTPDPEPTPEPDPEPDPEPEPKPAPVSRAAPRAAPKRNASDSNMATILAKQEQVMLMIHEMENPPPGGVSVFINGYGYQIQPGQWVQVPIAVVEVLENAVETKSTVADGKIIGSRTVPRYSYSTKPVKA